MPGVTSTVVLRAAVSPWGPGSGDRLRLGLGFAARRRAARRLGVSTGTTEPY